MSVASTPASPSARPPEARTRDAPHRSLGTRAERWRALLDGPFDLLVVGGGITGAGIASEATRRGARVALVEREDFGGGTSGATSKMLHGGLRYLQQRKIRLVREALLERGRLVRALGPDRVQRTEFLLPLDGGFGHRLSLRFGTWLYERLSGRLSLGPRRRLSPSEVTSRVPFLAMEGVHGGVLYFEGVVDDTLLTLVRVGQAVERGAFAVNHVEAVAPLLEKGELRGVSVRDRLTGATGEVRAKQVINAAGVWSTSWAGGDRSPALRPSKGVHLVFRRERLPLEVAVVLGAPEGRWVFALPYGPLAIVGTTDTEAPPDPDHVRAEPDDVRYLLEVARRHFPSLHLGPKDVVDVYAGLRPLLAGPAARTNDLSREDVVHRDASGLLTVVGGKLTTHRAMAERALKVSGIGDVRSGTNTPTSPARGPLPTTSEWNWWAFPPRWERTPCPGATLTSEVLRAPRESWGASLSPWVGASVRVAGAGTLVDVIDRRLHTLQRLDPAFPELVSEVAREVQGLLGWTDAERDRQREDYLARARFETQAVLAARGGSESQ